MKTFPWPETLRRRFFGLADIAVTIGTLLLLMLTLRVGDGALESFRSPDFLPTINLDLNNPPSHESRSASHQCMATLRRTARAPCVG